MLPCFSGMCVCVCALEGMEMRSDMRSETECIFFIFFLLADALEILASERKEADPPQESSWLHREVHILVRRAGRLTDENMWQF